jgi:SAM-dependent methyltransferase
MNETQAPESARSAANPDYTGTDSLEVLADAKLYAKFLRRLIQGNCPADAKMAVDFGAGIGTFSDALPANRCRTVCVEQDLRHQRILRGKGYEVRNLDEIEEGSVDYIYTLNVLEHIPADGDTLRILHRKLRTGGIILVYVPAFRLLWSSIDDKVGHVRRYTRASLLGVMKTAGFAIDRCRYADSAGFFATLAFKAIGKADGSVGRGSILAFDRVAFPIGRVLDGIGVSRLFGKNVFCRARKAIER